MPYIFPIVCQLAHLNGFTCPGVNDSGACVIYNNDGILGCKRKGACPYKEIRDPRNITEDKRFVNPIKASKKKKKHGA